MNTMNTNTMNTNMKWYLKKAEGSNGLILIRTARRIESSTCAPLPNAGAVPSMLRTFRELHYPIGIEIDLAPAPTERWLPARLAKRFDTRLWDMRWTQDGAAFIPVKLRWHDDASYIAYQSDCGDEGDFAPDEEQYWTPDCTECGHNPACCTCDPESVDK